MDAALSASASFASKFASQAAAATLRLPPGASPPDNPHDALSALLATSGVAGLGCKSITVLQDYPIPDAVTTAVTDEGQFLLEALRRLRDALPARAAVVVIGDAACLAVGLGPPGASGASELHLFDGASAQRCGSMGSLHRRVLARLAAVNGASRRRGVVLIFPVLALCDIGAFERPLAKVCATRKDTRAQSSFDFACAVFVWFPLHGVPM